MSSRRSSIVFLVFATLAVSAFTSPQAIAKIKRFQEVDPGKIFRGSQPEDEQDFKALKELKIRTLISLRTSRDIIDWERAMADRFEIQLISQPTSPLLIPTASQINEIQVLLKDPQRQPLFIHCKHGKDRTGLMVGVYRVETQGWTPTAAYEEMKAIGFNPWLFGLEIAFWSRTRSNPTTFLLPDLNSDLF